MTSALAHRSRCAWDEIRWLRIALAGTFALSAVAVYLRKWIAGFQASSREKNRIKGVSKHMIFISKSHPEYDTFRIPALLHIPAHPEGQYGETLLAFAEGRRESIRDWGAIDLVLRRSVDGGRTFSDLQVIASGADVGMPDGATVGNPAPVFEHSKHAVVLLLTVNCANDNEASIWARKARGSREVFVMQSKDAGQTWSQPRNITSLVKLPSWTWYATGPGAGIQTRTGRLIIACDHVDTTPDGYMLFASHVIISDDYGETWRIGGSGAPFTNECTVVELADGALLLNMRDFGGGGARVQQQSMDGGESWSAATISRELEEPAMHGCQAHAISVKGDDGSDESLPGGLYFSNPASTSRRNLTIRWSSDDGASWRRSVVIHAGFSAYSSLQSLGPPGAPSQIGVLYESGEHGPYEHITLAILSASVMVDNPLREGGANFNCPSCVGTVAQHDETFGAWG